MSGEPLVAVVAFVPAPPQARLLFAVNDAGVFAVAIGTSHVAPHFPYHQYVVYAFVSYKSFLAMIFVPSRLKKVRSVVKSSGNTPFK